jgi:GTP-binding protein
MATDLPPQEPTTPAYDADALERGRWLFAQECTFVKGVVALTGLPDADRSEIAFAGRSNVGKSSLVNALTGRNTLARTSNTPGRTRELNFFSLTPGLFLVDLPGYGYARVERALVEKWIELLKAYLAGRPNLKRICILIDSRHGLKASDIEMMDMLDVAAVTYQIILTKADKIPAAKLKGRIEGVQKKISRRPAAHPVVLVTSSFKKQGIEELRAELATLADWSLIPYKTHS